VCFPELLLTTFFKKTNNSPNLPMQGNVNEYGLAISETTYGGLAILGKQVCTRASFFFERSFFPARCSF
jgi:hypothetical protein